MTILNPFVSFPAAGGAFSPLDLPDLVVWADPSDTDTVSKNASNLLAWEDKSGNNNDVVISATHGDVYGTRTINSLNVMDLWASSPGGSIYFPISGVGASATLFVVFQRDAGNGQLFDIRNSGNGTPLHDDGATGGFRSRTRNDAGSLVNGNSATQDTSAHVYTFRSDASAFGAYHDGSLIGGSTTSRSGTLTGLDRLWIGQSSSRIDGAVGEVILCGSALSATDREATEGYLADKWGTP